LFELFGGYSYFAADPYTFNYRTGLNGFDIALGINATRWLDIQADLQSNYGDVEVPVLTPDPFPPCTPLCPPSPQNFPAHTHALTYQFGANFPYRRWEKVTPFGQFLVGRTHVSGTAHGTTSPSGVTEQDTHVSYSFGAGVDYKINTQLAWRTSGDYVVTNLFSHKQDNWRVSTGVVWHITRKKKQRTLTTP
jgi:opacity protein-like surface antigen